MANDPALTSFIIVGVVGGVAVIMNASAHWEITHELKRATDSWNAPLVLRTYPDDSTGRQRISTEAAVLHGHGYTAAQRRAEHGVQAPESAAVPGARSVRSGSGASGNIVITYLLS